MSQPLPTETLDALAARIAAWLAPEALLDADDVGVLLKCPGRYVLEWHCKNPDFPKPRRLGGPDGRLGHPRWQRRQILSYLEDVFDEGEAKKPGKPGRPRRRPGVAA